jgi:chromosome segregation ATPase
MSHSPLPAPGLPEESAAPIGRDAHGLHARLQTAFPPKTDAGPDAAKDDLPKIGAAGAAQAFAAATLRHGEAFENFQDRIVQLESSPDIGAMQENMRDLCEALLHITTETKKAATESEQRFESLSDAMAILTGHLASQRQDVQANIAATSQLTQQLKQLQDEIAGQRAEAAQIKDLILSTGQSLRNDLEAFKDQVAPLNGKLEAEGLCVRAIESRIAALPDMASDIASLTVRVDDLEPGAASLASRVNDVETGVASLTERAGDLELDTVSLTSRVAGLEPLKASVVQLAAEDAKLLERCSLSADDLDAAKTQLTGLEDTVAALADSSIRSSEGLSVLGNALEAAKTQIFSLSETSVYLTERLRIAEQVVEESSRREKILATLHARAARTLQSGQ